jgi:hypothetical protein
MKHVGTALLVLFLVISAPLKHGDALTINCNTNPAVGCTVGSYSFRTFDEPANGTGLGNYNVILFTQGGGGAANSGGAVNVDNSNTTLPPPGNPDPGNEFWYTSAGDLQAFYTQQFGLNAVNEIVLFLDVNEEGGGPNDIQIESLTIIKNPTTIIPGTTPSPAGIGDLTSAQQEGITGFTGGTTLASLSGDLVNLLQVDTGAGTDDWIIRTGINPYSLLPSDTLLFLINLQSLDNGGETVSINGEFRSCEPDCGGIAVTATGIPEPSSLILLGFGLLAVARRVRASKD